jgi:Xaa-Pro aminopeptidase
MPDNSPATQFNTRQSCFLDAIQAEGFDALALNAGPTLAYLTGLHFHLSERPVIALFSPGEQPTIFLPELEGRKVENLPFSVNVSLYGEDPLSWGKSLTGAVKPLNLEGRRIGVEPRRFRVLELSLLEAAIPDAQILSGEDCVARLRMQKDQTELAAMRQAIVIAQSALTAILPTIKHGSTERQLASTLALELPRNGSVQCPLRDHRLGRQQLNHAVTDRQLQPAICSLWIGAPAWLDIFPICAHICPRGT